MKNRYVGRSNRVKVMVVKRNFQQYFSYIVVVSFIGGDTRVPGEILCVLEISILSINKIFRLAFGNVLRVW